MKNNNKIINISFAKMLASFLVLGIFLSLTSCFEDEKDLFYKTTVAAFDVDVDETTLEATFTNNSAMVAGDDGVTGSASFDWDFGDESSITDTSTDEDPTYIYPVEGEYIVTLTLTDADGTVSTATRTIEVSDGIDN